MKTIKRRKRRRRRPGELAHRKYAIVNFCRECMGYNSGGHGSLAEAIRECTNERCWLYPWRNGKLDEEA